MANNKARSNNCGNKGKNRKSRRYGEGQPYKRDGMDGNKTRPEAEDLKGSTKGRNDAAWYGPESQLMKDAAQLSFATTTGLELDFNDSANRWTGDFTKNIDYMPGVMSLTVAPTFGELKDWSSPFNVAVRDMYSFIRHANSGHSNYDAANLGMYLIAYDSACTYYAWMVRLYGLMRTVIVRNSYTPRSLVWAAGGDYDDLVTQLADFRGYINSFAARLFALKVPSKLHMIERHMWLFTHVFADSPVDKASFYVFRPAGFWLYDLGTTPETTAIKLSSADEARLIGIKNFGETILNKLLNDEDFNIMSGDIIKAYGDNVFRINMIAEDYAVMPVYDPEVLMQIHNATLICTDTPTLSNSIQGMWKIQEDTSETSNVGALVATTDLPIKETDSTYLQSLAYAGFKHLLDMPTAFPTPAEVCVATRLMVSLKAADRGSLKFDALGTEVILRATIMTSADDHVGTRVNADAAYDLEKFDWHPYLWRGVVASQGDEIDGAQMIGIYGDIDNYTLVDHATLYNIHRAAMLGMFEMV